MKTTEYNGRIAAAEKAWQDAYDAHDRNDTAYNYHAMDSAWDAYVELCNDADQCLTVGCREITPQFAYCEQHRGWARSFGKDAER